jgi:hypothetical protein
MECLQHGADALRRLDGADTTFDRVTYRRMEFPNQAEAWGSNGPSQSASDTKNRKSDKWRASLYNNLLT